MKKIVVLVSLAIGLSAFASAADSFDWHVADIQILASAKVQDELGVNKATKAKFDSIAANYRKEVEGYARELQGKGVNPSTDKTAQARFKSMIEKLKKNVLGQLSAGQIKRLREISLQATGYRAYLDPVVQAKLGMTKAESKAVEAAFKKGGAQNESYVNGLLAPIRKKYSAMKPKTREDAELYQAQANKEMRTAMDSAQPRLRRIQSETEGAMRKAVSAKVNSTFVALKGKPSKAVSGS